jgi:peptidoglycan biosynthesis protein MviN/MurJ (putative lipid II flippase)
MRIALAVVLLNLILNFILIWFLREAGLAWSTAACAIVQVTALLILLRRQLSGVIDTSVRLSWIRSAIVTFVMAGILAGIDRTMPASLAWREHLLHLFILVAGGALVVAFLAKTFRMPELRWALGGSVRDGE